MMKHIQNTTMNNTYVYFTDIHYTDTYNPEQVKQKKREYRYVIDGDGKERLCVIEEIEEKDTEENYGK